MIRKLKNFLKNTAGNFAITTGIIAFPLFTAAGIALDYSNFVNLRNSVRSAMDASGLAAGAEFVSGAESSQQLEQYAEDFFLSNLPEGLDAEQYDFNFQFLPAGSEGGNENESLVKISASVKYDTYFGNLLGVETLSEAMNSTITIGNRTVEIALVLDNSGSMGGRRLRALREQSQNLVDTVFGASKLIDIERAVQFSLVPFSGTVNVGPENRNARWMDRRGWADSHHENLDWQNTYRTNNTVRLRKRNINGRTQVAGVREFVGDGFERRTRFDIFDMLGTEWGGCVEMRPWPHNVLDTSTNTNRSFRHVRDSVTHPEVDPQDGHNALFVPYFAPDEPDEDFAENDSVSSGNPPFVNLSSENRVTDADGNNVRVDFDTDDDRYRNNYLYDFIDYGISGGVVDFDKKVQLFTDLDTQNDSNYNYPNHAHRPAVEGQNPTRAEVNPQRGANNQVNRTNWVFKYQIGELRNDFGFAQALSDTHGPNDGCRSNPITPLTEDKEEISAAISAMNAAGTTNIHQGLTWGWRTLTAAEPFTGGRQREDGAANLKIVVLLSDGNNFYGTDADSTPNQTAYGAWGYARTANHLVNPVNGLDTHNRWLGGLTSDDLEGTIYQDTTFDLTPETNRDFELIMNAHTNQACRNIKRDGVSIYSIAFDVPTSGGVRELLEACAGVGLETDGETPVTSQELNPRYFFDVQEESELKRAFEEIARQISNLRISG